MRALLGGLFDYAGMFPPASLAFEDALRTAASFGNTLERPWLVGAEAVLGIERLGDLTPDFLLGCGFRSPLHVRVALLGTLEVPEVMSETVLASWEAGVEDWDPDAVRLAAAAAGRQGMRFYVEPRWPPDRLEREVGGLADRLARINRQTAGPGAGIKVRGAGPTAIAPPALAAVIAAVAERGLAFKATAGLHHPLVEPARYGNALGFLGLVAALRLHQALGPERFGVDRVVECLGAADPSEFRFGDALAWRDYSVGQAELAAAAEAVPFSIGSCSLHEPDADLSRLFPEVAR
ncbi:MAG: hypothetical protein FJZ01_20695 [Candidatus Sericytochromatia bacterium]|nr:hypothetical protein [Candidatus Tanganyikabacteria bacterium]